MSGRKDFLTQQAPENYVAGLGRGATGFTTRSDLGPARDGPSEEQIKEALAKRAAQLGNAPPTAYGLGKKKGEDDAGVDEEQFRDAENEEGLFATGNYDRDDDEADRIYQTVDERMDRRRKARRFVLPRSSSSIFDDLGTWSRPARILKHWCSSRSFLPQRTHADEATGMKQGSARARATRRARAQQPQDSATICRFEKRSGRRDG